MSTDLHTLLADELGISPAEAEEALTDLLRDVTSRARQGEDVSLQGLGTFSIEEETLHFSPSPFLEKAVNYRNEQLAPLTVGRGGGMPADRSEPAEAPPPIEDVPDDAVAPADAPPAADEPFDDAEPWEASPVEQESPPHDEAPVDTSAEEVVALSDDWTEELAEDNAAPSAAPRRTASPDAASTGQIAGLIAAVGLLALLLWVVLGMQGIVPGPTALFQSTASDAPEADPVTETATTAPDDPSTEAASPADTAEATAEAERPDDAPAMPPTIDRRAGGWTLVVASRTRPQDAERVLETFQQRFQGSDVPVDILTGSSNGRVRYRIAVGQYDAPEAAQAGLRALQDRLPDDAWVLRIQPNS